MSSYEYICHILCTLALNLTPITLLCYIVLMPLITGCNNPAGVTVLSHQVCYQFLACEVSGHDDVYMTS